MTLGAVLCWASPKRIGVSENMFRNFKTPRRVVITGMGCVTPIGIGREAFWNGLQRGESGVRRIESFDVSDSPVKIAAQVRDFDWQAQLGPKDRKHVPRTVPLALAAAREALADAFCWKSDKRLVLRLERAVVDYRSSKIITPFGTTDVRIRKRAFTSFPPRRTGLCRANFRWRSDCGVCRMSFRPDAPVRLTRLLTRRSTSR